MQRTAIIPTPELEPYPRGKYITSAIFGFGGSALTLVDGVASVAETVIHHDPGFLIMGGFVGVITAIVGLCGLASFSEKRKESENRIKRLDFDYLFTEALQLNKALRNTTWPISMQPQVSALMEKADDFLTFGKTSTREFWHHTAFDEDYRPHLNQDQVREAYIGLVNFKVKSRKFRGILNNLVKAGPEHEAEWNSAFAFLKETLDDVLLVWDDVNFCRRKDALKRAKTLIAKIPDATLAKLPAELAQSVRAIASANEAWAPTDQEQVFLQSQIPKYVEDTTAAYLEGAISAPDESANLARAQFDLIFNAIGKSAGGDEETALARLRANELFLRKRLAS